MTGSEKTALDALIGVDRQFDELQRARRACDEEAKEYERVRAEAAKVCERLSVEHGRYSYGDSVVVVEMDEDGNTEVWVQKTESIPSLFDLETEEEKAAREKRSAERAARLQGQG